VVVTAVTVIIIILLLLLLLLLIFGIATRYGLDGLGIAPRQGRIFAPIQTGPGAHPASFTMGTVILGDKAVKARS